VTELVVHFSVDGERAVLSLVGELDLDSVSELRLHAEAELAARRWAILTIDLSDLTFIDSTGLALLVELRRKAAVSNVTVEVINIPGRVARVMGIAGLGETFGLTADDASTG
jgi:anti-anti-sigma factor